MATTGIIQTLGSELLGLAITELNANQPQVMTWIASGETEVQAFIVSLIKQIPAIKGPFGMVAGPILAAFETAIENWVAAYLAKEPPATVFALIIALLTHLQSLA